ncbi:SNF7 family protein [Zea mays]|uniref:SNF7 family protein n=1 Tax=Zea mays TaxID=4577 RepID=A0A1D6MP26_MAIZE|nr:SNF7 family protein [Zea mays]
MQAAATAAGFSAVLPAKGRPAARSRVVARVPATRRSVRVAAVVATEAAQIDYSSSVSYVFPGLDQQTTSRCRAKFWMVWVFPMEACDLLGGDACNGPMFPEAKPASAAAAASRSVVGVDRDYLSYDEPKTVFPGEACDDLGGEFCEAPYQDGVSKELAHA